MFQEILSRGEHLARVEANRAILRFVNGIDWMIRDPATVVGQTPYEVIYQRDKLQVRRYHHRAAAARPRFDLPILLVPPLMVKPFIFDLFPGRSLVAFLLEEGFDVYLVDFGEPDQADAFVTLDNYVLDWLPAACEAVTTNSGVGELSMLGYCMGGLFALSYVAVHRKHLVRNIVSIGAPVDTHKMGLLAWVVQNAGGQVEFLARRIGNVPGGLSSAVFRLLAPVKNVTRYADLFMNLWNREYMNGFDAMNRWVAEFIDYPQGAFQQFVSDFMRHNKLARGQMKFGKRTADLKRVDVSLLVIAGRTDQISPVDAVRAALDTVGGSDKTFILARGGHMGVFAGSSAPEQVWKPAAQWLSLRSAADIEIPKSTRRGTTRKVSPARAARRRGAEKASRPRTRT